MKHLFFDLDRTLWDFETNSKNALQHLYDELNLHEYFRSFQSFHTRYKKINAELWSLYSKNKITKERLRVKRFEDTLIYFNQKNQELAERLANRYVEFSPHQTALFPNTIETLEQLTNEGYKLHIITNGFREVQFIKLTKCQLIDFFDVIVCSEDVGKQKPAKEVFDYAMKLANAQPHESIMIGDSYQADIRGATNAGIASILFDPHHSHKEGTHPWHIDQLNKLPELIPFIKTTEN